MIGKTRGDAAQLLKGNDAGMTPLFCVSFSGLNGVEGHVVVDSLVNGTSSGGVRIVSDLEVGEVRMLAAEMTLKYAFCGLPRGGAKCGIRMSAGLSREERLAALEDVGRRISAIIGTGIYYPGMDMNCGPEELRAICLGAGFALGNMTDTSLFTGLFAAEAIRACADVLFPEERFPLTIAIEGFGAVASHLAGMLEPERFRIMALSTIGGGVCSSAGFDPGTLREVREIHGDDMVNHLPGEKLASREELLSVPADILVPAARVGSIHQGNAGRIAARCVVSVANAPCTAEALDVLQRRGIPVLPGFVCNAGGVLGSSLFDRGVPRRQVEKLAAGPYRQAVSSLLRRSLELGEQPADVATCVARGLMLSSRDEPVSKSTRLLATLARRVTVAKLFVNRHAARDCSAHFTSVAELIRQVEPRFVPVAGK